MPLLSAGNWGGMGLHPRGNFEGYLRAGSQAEMARGARRHALHAFLQPLRRGAAEALLRPFPQGRGHRLGPAAARLAATSAIPARSSSCAPRTNGRSRARNGPNISCSRTGRGFGHRAAAAETSAELSDGGDGLTFLHAAADRRAWRSPARWRRSCWCRRETTDADLFLVLRVFDPAGKEVTFIGSNDPRTPVGLGWLRASHRKLDPAQHAALSAVAHARRGMAAHAGRAGRARHRDLADLHRRAARLPLGLTVRGKDYEYDGTDAGVAHAPYPMKGVGPFPHADPHDRPPRYLRRHEHAALRARAGCLICCCRSFRSVGFGNGPTGRSVR